MYPNIAHEFDDVSQGKNNNTIKSVHLIDPNVQLFTVSSHYTVVYKLLNPDDIILERHHSGSSHEAVVFSWTSRR